MIEQASHAAAFPEPPKPFKSKPGKCSKTETRDAEDSSPSNGVDELPVVVSTMAEVAAVVTCMRACPVACGVASSTASCVPLSDPPYACPGPVSPSCPHPQWTRWTLRKLRTRIQHEFGINVSRETVRKVLHQLGLSWKKAKKLLGRADRAARAAFVEDIQALLQRGLRDDSLLLVYIDEAHVHQDADLGYGWSTRGKRLWVTSSAPGLHAKVSFYGVYLYSESQVRIWPYERANSEHTIDVLLRLRRELKDREIVVLWDGASYHRAVGVLETAEALKIRIVRLPGYSPDFMPVEALWKWMREEVTYNRVHDTAAALRADVEKLVEKINLEPETLGDRLWVKDALDPEEEAMRFGATANVSCSRVEQGTPRTEAERGQPQRHTRHGPKSVGHWEPQRMAA